MTDDDGGRAIFFGIAVFWCAIIVYFIGGAQ